MKPWKTIGSARTDAGELLLQERNGEYQLRSGGQVLMGSRQHGSEDALARAVCAELSQPKPRVLIGGLGFGFTLRAALDVLPAQAQVDVAELSAELVSWNQGVLGPLAGLPLQDSRVKVEVADVRQVLSQVKSRFDAILLDVDNGPRALTRPSNAELYSTDGLGRAHRALSSGGVLAVWSAGPDDSFVRHLRDAGFRVQLRGAAAVGAGSGRHTLFLAYRT